MAQRISSMPYSQEGFVLSSAERGLGAMLPQNQGMTNRQDMGTGALADVNGQTQRQYDLAMQDVRRNTETARPQAVVQSTNAYKKQETEALGAQNFLTTKLTTVAMNNLEQMGGSNSLMEFNAVMQGPQRDMFINDIATGKKMGEMLG